MTAKKKRVSAVSKKRRAQKPKIEHEAFVLRAIQATRHRVQPYHRHDTDTSHLSTRLNRIAGAFRRYYGEDIGPTIDRMIKAEKIWAIHTVWGKNSTYGRTQLQSADCLESFPDPHLPDAKNPTLYIDGKVPSRVLGTINRSPQKRLRQILEHKEAAELPN